MVSVKTKKKPEPTYQPRSVHFPNEEVLNRCRREAKRRGLSLSAYMVEAALTAAAQPKCKHCGQVIAA